MAGVKGGSEWARVLPALGVEDAIVIGLELGEPMLRLCRLTRSADGSALEFHESILDPDLFVLHMAF
ncbi:MULTISPECIES: hypothetical protein [unclassified Ruegeria]|uniref:hypothetical protein n=1 Tax=unclassified Ruegeria TaxID=2625375 RepID=UPI001492D92C|nr:MULTISPECIES: hypothetical protein [unclassified Ruegeria]NOD47748.1 hypothetical protein [Ruegeria sp. HKCCD5849]NOD52589.1 hypothetical protein [Ruegeria sp. HKCCD5851]NOD66008.1 hypothetical protein [Ruegeria sp. HKCCD7303]